MGQKQCKSKALTLTKPAAKTAFPCTRKATFLMKHSDYLAIYFFKKIQQNRGILNVISTHHS